MIFLIDISRIIVYNSNILIIERLRFMSEKNAINLSNETQEFLWYSYFSTSYENTAKDIDMALYICVQRAYLDLNRTFAFNTDDENERRNFRDSVCKKITADIKGILINCTKSNFDDFHNNICMEIVDYCNDYPKDKREKIFKVKESEDKAFHYGQAQKWLNMTLKYMIIMGFWTEKFNSIIEVFHVPVDSYIMEATSNLEIMLPRKNGDYGKYFESSSKPWSKWNKDDYIKFQQNLRIALKNKNPSEIPIKWEAHAWIEVARNKK